jgi:hypothetical protein
MPQALNAISCSHFEQLVWRAFRARIVGGRKTSSKVGRRSARPSPADRAKGPRVWRAVRAGTAERLSSRPVRFDTERWRERAWLCTARYAADPRRAATLARRCKKCQFATHRDRNYRACPRPLYPGERGRSGARSTQRAPSRTGPGRCVPVSSAGWVLQDRGPDMLVKAAAPFYGTGG